MMANADQPTITVRERPPIRAAFAWLGFAWLIWLLGLARGAWVNAQFIGPGDDVTDSLRRAGYIGERLLAFDVVAVASGVVAGCVLLRAERTTGWVVLAWAVVVSSALLHGLALLMHLTFAG